MLFIRIEEKGTPKQGDKKRVVLTVTKKNNYKVDSVNVQLLSPSGETVAIGQANRISSSDWVFKLAAPPEKGELAYCYGFGCLWHAYDKAATLVTWRRSLIGRD